MSSWRERECATQARCREDNEATARLRLASASPGRTRFFRCECGDRRCALHFPMTLAEYESIRAHATRFAVAPDHENPEREHLIAEHARFAVVESVSGPAVMFARKSYPRRWTFA